MSVPSWQRCSERYSGRSSERPCSADIDRRPQTVDHRPETGDSRGTSTAAFASPSKTSTCKHQKVDASVSAGCLQEASRSMKGWKVQPVALVVANTFVRAHHRHAVPVVGHLFSLGLFDPDWCLHGAVIVGRPVARALDDGTTAEVTRLVTYGTPNACSKLYGAAQREAVARGYRRVVTYTRSDESGASPAAANFRRVALVRGRQWDTPSRPRQLRDVADRWRWEWTP